MTEEEVKFISNYIAKIALEERGEEKVNIAVKSLLSSYEKEGFSDVQNNKNAAPLSTTITFTQKELSKMSVTFKKEFIANGLVAHVIKRTSGKKSFCYEIRYRSNGYNISASSTDLNEAKKKFLIKTSSSEIEKYRVSTAQKTTNSFENIFNEWFEYKKTTVTPKVINTHKKHFLELPIDLRQKQIETIRTNDIAKCLNVLEARMYEEYRTLFNMIFKYAIASGIISHNPVALIPFKRADRQNREALSNEEVLLFLETVKEPKYAPIRQAAYLYYFFGLRASEIDHETRRENNFLITRNRKRKGGKIEYKKIPIPVQADKFINWNKPLTISVTTNTSCKLFRSLLGEDKSSYNLRHTFATICQQYVRPDIVDIWMGDSPQRLVGKVYTHFPDDFMREQMAKVNFPIIN